MRFVYGHNLRTLRGPQKGNWRGDEIGYRSLHTWVTKNKEKTGVCTGCERERYTEWANVSGVYLRDLDDFAELCTECHWELDHGWDGEFD